MSVVNLGNEITPDPRLLATEMALKSATLAKTAKNKFTSFVIGAIVAITIFPVITSPSGLLTLIFLNRTPKRSLTHYQCQKTPYINLERF